MTVYLPYGAMPSRRVRRLQITADFFLAMFSGLDGTRIVECRTPIPKDARVVGMTVDERFNIVALYVESSEFDEVEAATTPPDWSIDFGYTRWPGGRSDCKTCYGLRVVDDLQPSGEYRPKPCPDCT